MNTLIIDGRALAARIRAEATEHVRHLGFRPGLAVILVGQDPASHLYVALKEKACAEAGLFFERHDFPVDVTQNEILSAVDALNRRDDLDAILVQLPLPPQLDPAVVIGAIDPKKDADGFSPAMLRSFLEGTGKAPGLVEAISLLLDEAGAPEQGFACVLGNSAVFTLPVETMLDRRGLPVIEDPRAADVIVTALGKPKSLTAADVKPGAIVIDVGTTRVLGKTVGDVDADSLEGRASALTPVPGGVGPMTVAMLIRRTVEMARARWRK